MISLIFDPKLGIWCEEEEGLDKLRKNFFGVSRSGKLFLDIEEALYIISFMNGVCETKSGEVMGFNELASHYSSKDPRLFIKYNAFRDWRDRGLIIKRMSHLDIKPRMKKHRKRYPARDLEKVKINAKAYWHPKAMFSVIDDERTGQKLFQKYWLGQLGIYKQERGELLKLDFFETVFLAKHFNMKVINSDTRKPIKWEQIFRETIKEREYAEPHYEVYEDWRLKGYVVKTGFKFGSHFRIYFPGASPGRSEEKWIHSKHVLHVFPKEQKMLISEWARAVRVAHGVKKTFLLSIPEMTEKDYRDYPTAFISYRRKKIKGNWIRETPEDRPRYLFADVSEEEQIGGVELASLLRKAEKLGLDLILSITDRETAITYYVLNKVLLPGSDFVYYEIEWMKP
jgi:tRNA-intron endonuclease